MSWRTEIHAIHAICILWVMILTLSIPAFVIHGEVSMPWTCIPTATFQIQMLSYNRVFVDSLHFSRTKFDSLPNSGSVRLDFLPGALLPIKLRDALGVDMRFLHVHVGQVMARCAHQCREPTRKKTGYQTRRHRRCCLRFLLVPYTGKEICLEQMIFPLFYYLIIHNITSATSRCRWYWCLSPWTCIRLLRRR